MNDEDRVAKRNRADSIHNRDRAIPAHLITCIRSHRPAIPHILTDIYRQEYLTKQAFRILDTLLDTNRNGHGDGTYELYGAEIIFGYEILAGGCVWASLD